MANKNSFFSHFALVNKYEKFYIYNLKIAGSECKDTKQPKQELFKTEL